MAENQERAAEKDLSVLPGNEKKVDYTVLPVPEKQGRFSFTGSVFLNRLSKFILVNVLMLLFAAPLVALFIGRTYYIAWQGSLGPYADWLGVGVGRPDIVGEAERLMLEADATFFAVAVFVSLIAAVGLAGGMYCVRKLLRSDDKLRLFRDFFTGVRQGYVAAAIACVIAFAGILLAVFVWDYAALAMATGGSAGLWITLRVLACILCALLTLFALWILSVGTNYKQNALGLLKNAAVIGGGTIVQSVIFAAFAALPAFLVFFNVSMLNFVLEIFYVVVGGAAALLVWGSFSDWAFDNFAGYTAVQTRRQEEARREALRAETPETDVMGLLLTEERHEYLSRAIQSLDEGTQVYALPENFGPYDLEQLAESRRKMESESRAFAERYADEEKYKEYNARFAEREKALVEKDKKGRKKKFAPPKMLNQ